MLFLFASSSPGTYTRNVSSRGMLLIACVLIDCSPANFLGFLFGCSQPMLPIIGLSERLSIRVNFFTFIVGAVGYTCCCASCGFYS